MQFEWDEKKRLANIKKHGIDFVDVPAVFDDDIVTVIDDRFDYGETRYQTLGLLKSRVIMVVHTESDTVIRLISARKANRYEEKTWFSEISN
ncbi:MAG: BrnT family toxin [Chloroflexota bacterium]